MLTNVREADFTEWSVKYFKKNILPHFPPGKNIHVLEIGCGYGRYTKFISEQGFASVYGIDISEEQINYAKHKIGLSNVELADAVEYLERQPKKFDVVLLMDVMEHLELDYSILLLQNIYRSLSPKGRLIIQVPNGMAPLSPPFHSDVTHKRAYSPGSMSQSLRMGGFSLFRHYPLPPSPQGILSSIRRIIWLLLLNPAIKLFLLLANGGTAGGIYTSNLLTIAEKNVLADENRH